MHELIHNLKNIYNHSYCIYDSKIILKKTGKIFRDYITSVKYITKGKHGFIFKVVIDGITFCFKITLHNKHSGSLYETEISEKINQIPNILVRKFYISISGFGVPKLNEDSNFYQVLRYSFKKDRPCSIIAVYEWVDGLELSAYLSDKSKIYNLIEILKSIIYTLKRLYQFIVGFRHNDLHLQNIIVKTVNNQNDQNTDYTIIPYLIDFDFATCYSLPNPKVTKEIEQGYGIKNNGNISYDVHYLCNLLIHHYQFPIQIRELLFKIVPIHLRGQNMNDLIKDYRLLNDELYRIDLDHVLNLLKHEPN